MKSTNIEEVYMKVLAGAFVLAGAMSVQANGLVFANGQPGQSCQTVIAQAVAAR